MKNKNKRVFPLIIFSLIFLFNPSLNIIDLTPDFIAYLVLASLVSPSAEGLPYFKEMKDAFRRLAFLNIAKTVGVLVMFANLSTGSDIIPLFTLVFNALEVILLISAIKNTASALFYLGERSEATALITPFPFMAGRIKPEALRLSTVVFCIARAVITFLPEISLLTYGDPKVAYIFKLIYTPAVLSALALNTLLGILWLIPAICYTVSVMREGKAVGSATAILDTARLDEIKAERRFKSKTGALTALFLASFFTFELLFKETGDVSILPPFIYGFFIMYIASKLLDQKRLVVSAMAVAGGFCLVSFITYAVKIFFHSTYDYMDLYLRKGEGILKALEYNPATRIYSIICVLSLLETALFVAMIALLAFGFMGFIKRETALSPSDPHYSAQDRNYHGVMIKKSIVLFAITALTAITKCINVFLRGDVKLIFSEDSQAATIIETSALPWFHYVYFGLSVLLVFFTYFFVAELKNDMKMKHSDKRTSVLDGQEADERRL